MLEELQGVGFTRTRTAEVLGVSRWTVQRAETILVLFLSAVERDAELRPSRIRVYYGVENVLVCDKMVQVRGELYCRAINTQPTD